MKKLAIKTAGLTHSYGHDNIIFENLSIEVEAGDSVGIIGKNGCGKTTLFYILSGIIKPQKGSVQILGIESEYKKFNPSIGYVFQQAEDMLFNPTVFDEIAFGLLNLGLSEEETAKRVLKTLNDFGIEELSDRPPLHLSGGEKRMLSIASVMAMEPDVLLFDEPNNDLDSYTRRFLIEIINKNAATKLIASHDLEFILETCNKTVVLNRGRIYGAGKSEDILSDKKLMRECHLEVPASLKRS